MTDQYTIDAGFIGRKLAELDARQAQLEKHFDEVTGALAAMANDIKSHIDRTRERRFVEMAAARLYPAVYQRMSGEVSAAGMAKSAVGKAVALWQAVDQHFDARQDND
jgi:hypothetical protein